MRRVIPLLVLLSLPLAPVPAQEEPFELFIFDVSALVALHEPHLAPLLGPPGLVRFEEGYELERGRSLEGDALADLIRENIAAEVWDEGGDVQYRRGGILLVKCPPRVGLEISELIATLSDSLCRRVRYSVEVHELPVEAFADLGAGKLDLSLLPAESRRASASGVAWTGLPSSLSITKRIPWLGDYDVEIAQDTAIADPVVTTGAEGLSLDVLASTTSDGGAVIMEVFLQAGSFVRPLRELDLARSGRGAEPGNRLGRVQLPEYRGLIASVNGLVRPGEALAIPLAADGRVHLVLVKLLSIEGGQAGMPVLSTEAVTHRPRTMRLMLDEPGVVVGEGGSRGDMLLGGGVEDFMDLVTQNVRPDAWESGENRFGCTNDSLLVFGDPALFEEVASFLADIEKTALHPLRIDLGIWSTPRPPETGPREDFAPGKAAFLGGGTLRTLAGGSAFLVAGSTASHVADYDVEVARGSFIPKPVLGRTFEGLAGSVSPRFAGSGKEIEVALSLLLSSRNRPAPLDPGAHPHGPVELVESGRIRLDSTIRMPAGGVYVLDAGPDTSKPGHSLTLVIRARAD